MLKKLFRDAGLSVREDALGNTFARWEGERPDLSAVATGSHIDAIPHSGQFDGTVGVLGAIEAVRALARAGFRPVRPIEIVLFTSEEPTRFGIGCLGSRGICGSLSTDRARRTQGFRGQHTRRALAARQGFRVSWPRSGFRQNQYAAFVELHIEQGPLLERDGTPIGIVTAIAAPAALRVTWEGEGGHAGAVLMAGRRDALCAAAETVLGRRERGALDAAAPTPWPRRAFAGCTPARSTAYPTE